MALLIAGAGISSQRHSISVLRTETATLDHLISQANQRSDGSPDDVSQRSRPSTGKDSKKIDWKLLGGQLTQSGMDGMGDMRSFIRFQRQLQEMSRDELIDALDEIAGLELSDPIRKRIEQMVISSLGALDPEYVLNRFADSLAGVRESSRSWQLAHAMQEWAYKDPLRAAAWFDEKIAEGKFAAKSLNGKNRTRQQFEGSLIAALLEEDFEGASKRVEGLPADERTELLQGLASNSLKEKSQLAYAELLRTQIPGKDHLEALARVASQMISEDGYTKINDYMDRIQATPEERTACVEKAATSKIYSISHQKPVADSDIDSLREWAATQAPDRVNLVTGRAIAAIGQAGRKTTYSDTVAMVLRYHEAAPNDDILIGFLENASSNGNQGEARLLAEKITDEKRREEILKNYQ